MSAAPRSVRAQRTRARLSVRRYPELLELMDALEQNGIELGGASALVLAIATGPDFYAGALATDPDAWKRFRVAFEVMRTGRAGYIAPDSTTLGALAWVVVLGERFTESVASLMGQPGSGLVH